MGRRKPGSFADDAVGEEEEAKGIGGRRRVFNGRVFRTMRREMKGTSIIAKLQKLTAVRDAGFEFHVGGVRRVVIHATLDAQARNITFAPQPTDRALAKKVLWAKVGYPQDACRSEMGRG